MSIRAMCSLLALLALPTFVPAASPATQDFQEAVGKSPDLERGATRFRTCAGCHRENGRGNLDGSVPVIAGQHMRVTVKQLTDYRHAKRWDPRMQHYADNHVLPDVQAIADVAGYIAALDRKGSVGRGRGELVQRGLGIFASQCASCHGKAGEGDAATLVPRVAGQHYEYLLRQFHDAVEGRRPNFPAEHVRLLQRFERDDLRGLADALARME